MAVALPSPTSRHSTAGRQYNCHPNGVLPAFAFRRVNGPSSQSPTDAKMKAHPREDERHKKEYADGKRGGDCHKNCSSESPLSLGDEICRYRHQRDENECPFTVMAVLRIPGGLHCVIIHDAPNGEKKHQQDRIQSQYGLHVGTDVGCIWFEDRARQEKSRLRP